MAIALITGSSSGIGLATAVTLGHECPEAPRGGYPEECRSSARKGGTVISGVHAGHIVPYTPLLRFGADGFEEGADILARDVE
jgi:hypothetical protein